MAALLGGHWSRPTPFSRLVLKKFSLGDKRTNFWKTVYARKISLEKLSPEKMADWISEDILMQKSIANLLTVPPDLRHVQRDVRLSKSTVNQGLAALS